MTRTAARTVHRTRGWAHYLRAAAEGRLGARWTALYSADAERSLRQLQGDRSEERATERSTRGLDAVERSDFSQNGEDGVIAELLRRLGIADGTFVEIGASDGAENCTRALAERGFRGSWYEGDPERVALARRLGLDPVVVVQAIVTRSNVVELLDSVDTPADPDVFVLDIDGDDLGVLRSALGRVRPGLLVVEYNAAFVPPAVWSLPQRWARGWDGTFRFGASLQAFVDLLDGSHTLVHCDGSGVNAFFVRDDLVAEVGVVATASELYRPAAYSRHPFGHIRDRRAVRPGEPVELEPGVIRLEGRGPGSIVARPGEPVRIEVDLLNGTAATLRSGRPNGTNLVLRWISGEAETPADDSPRTTLAHPVPPGGRAGLLLWSPAPATPGSWTLRMTAVVEGVAWLEHLGGPGSVVDVPVEVVEPG